MINSCIQLINIMDNKSSTDIDRKLAVYYHPLFQQIIKAILDLFRMQQQQFEIGLLQFVQFNLKLQKSLLPTFQIDNALVSGLNDWVKEVAECLTYEGMVSTAGCVQVTPNNIQELLKKQYDMVNIKLFKQKNKFIEQMMKISTHDAFKLLGVKINKQVFSKFMFDLCSTWCQFLDVELFSYFLVGLYVQISKGQTIESSQFKTTLQIETIDIEFMEEFEEIKALYNRSRKKDLRYYRAWCEWNYLRVNEVGEKLILKLDQLHADDNRILQLAMIFERAIKVINEQITNQNTQKQLKQQKKKENNSDQKQNKDFLILKKLNIQNESIKQSVKAKNQQVNDQQQAIIYEEQPAYVEPQIPQDFEIQIDEQGNMYLKRIVKLPVLGVKIQPQNFHTKQQAKRKHVELKKQQWRAHSNLYGRMESLKIRLQHSSKNDYYAFKKNPKIKQRDEFYLKNDKYPRVVQMDQTIHQKMKPDESVKQQQKIVIPNIKRQQKVSIRQNKQYIHRVMAPSFLTDNQNNLSFAQKKQGEIYSNTANNQKRQLKLGLPKLRHLQFRVKQMKSYHLVGKLTNDRFLVNERAKVASFVTKPQNMADRVQQMKEQNKYIWSRYIDEEEMHQLTNYQEFYYKLEAAKRKFGMEFQSQFRVNLKPILAYDNKRHQMGGILTKEDQQRFSQRMKKLINKQNRRQKKKMRKEKMRQYRRNFKNKKQKSLYQDIFVNFHRNAIKQIKKDRQARHNSMYCK